LEDLVEWVTVATYQAASGAGAEAMGELVSQMNFLGEDRGEDPILVVEKRVREKMKDPSLPHKNLGQSLAGNLLPWIDSEIGPGISREEWKGEIETQKILGLKTPIPIESTCVRVGTLRCHAQAFTIKLKRDLSLSEVESILQKQGQWVEIIPNHKTQTLEKLTPNYVTGSLRISLGRLRKLSLGRGFISCFTVGDQLLWGGGRAT